jgi:signal recognition particle subunit SRP54
MRKGEFTLETFRSTLQQMKRLGPLNKLMGLIPGMNSMNKLLDQFDADDEQQRIFAIIDSMTPGERRAPKTIDQSRRRRIAAGAGVEPHEVNELVKQFDFMSGMMKEMAGLGMRDRMRRVNELQSGGFLDPGAKFGKQKVGTGKRLTTAEKKNNKKSREKEIRKLRREARDKGK